jgi:hypothetical protein
MWRALRFGVHLEAMHSFKLFFRSRNRICSAVCADVPAVVSDNIGCSVRDVSAVVPAGGLWSLTPLLRRGIVLA